MRSARVNDPQRGAVGERRDARHQLQGEPAPRQRRMAHAQPEPQRAEPDPRPDERRAVGGHHEQEAQVDDSQPRQQAEAAGERPGQRLGAPIGDAQRGAEAEPACQQQARADQRRGGQAFPSIGEHRLACDDVQRQREAGQRDRVQQRGAQLQHRCGEARLQCGAAEREPRGDHAGPHRRAQHPRDRGDRGHCDDRHQQRARVFDRAVILRCDATPHDAHRERACREHRHAEHRAGNQRRAGSQIDTELGHEPQRRAADHDERERARIGSMLTRAEPVHAGRFHGPRRSGPHALEREWNRQGAEDHADDHVRFAEQRIARVAAAQQRAAEQQIEQREAERRPCRPPLVAAHQQVLQAERGERHAERQRAVDAADALDRLCGACRERLARIGCIALGQRAAREHHADRSEEQEEQQQETLHARVERIVVVALRPGDGEREGRGGAEQVERAPGPEPRHQEDADVENREVAEQRDVVAAAGRDEHRRGEAFGHRDEREPRCVLRNGEQRTEHRDRGHEDEGERGRQQRMQLDRGERGQIEDPDSGALKNEAVALPAGRVGAFAKAPAEAEQKGADERHAGVAKLDRHADALGRVAQQEREAEEEDQHADLDDRVAAEDPAAHERRQPIAQRNRRRWRRRFRRTR